jgi:hypothetical protein
MAPMAAKMNLTLHMDGEGAAGARAGGLEAVKRQKTGSGGYKVSNNFARRYPLRDANKEEEAAKGTGYSSLLGDVLTI